MSVRMVTVLDPKFNPYPEGIHGPRAYPRTSDYYSVSALSTYGTFRVIDMLSPETKIALAAVTNRMERTTRKGTRKVGRRA